MTVLFWGKEEEARRKAEEKRRKEEEKRRWAIYVESCGHPASSSGLFMFILFGCAGLPQQVGCGTDLFLMAFFDSFWRSINQGHQKYLEQQQRDAERRAARGKGQDAFSSCPEVNV